MTSKGCILAKIRQEQNSVFLTLDSGEVLEVAPGSLPAEMPAMGESISSPLLAEIRLAAERKQIARRVFAMLDRRLQPVARLRDKLIEKGYSEEAVEAVLEQMARQDLHSDRLYAEAYCRDCVRGKTVGRRYLEQKLREKGVEAAVARAVPGEILDEETEAGLALQAARTRWRRERNTERRKAEMRIQRFLVGRGFPAGMAGRAMRAARDELETDLDGSGSEGEP
jgi:regulatory protein